MTDDLVLASRAFEKAAGARMPSSRSCGIYGRALKAALRKIFQKVDVIGSDEISGFFNRAAAVSPMPLASLSELSQSIPETMMLRLSRGVDESMRPLGLVARDNSAESPARQFERLAATLKQSGSRELAILDDVIFSGGSLLQVAAELSGSGLRVRRAYAVAAIAGGAARLNENGIETVSARLYPSVIDEICARDIVPGVYSGGRTCRMADGTIRSVPYLSAYGGDSERWASIPADQSAAFSEACERVARQYWREASRLNGRIIGDRELNRPLLRGSITALQSAP